MTNSRITSLMNAGDSLLKTIDPEGILASSKIVRIIHKLTDDRKGFAWKAEISFPNDDLLKISGQCHEDIGFFINKCVFVAEGEKVDIVLNQSETLFSAIEDVTRLPHRLKANLARIPLKTSFEDESESRYGLENISSAFNALFWEVEGGDVVDSERAKFNELIIVICLDSNGYCSKNNIIGIYNTGHSLIKARVTADMYGLSSRMVTLERIISGKDEISAYCYTEDFSGRKVPSLKLAFKLDRMLSAKDDIQQHVERNSMDMPAAEITPEVNIKEIVQLAPQKKQIETGKPKQSVNPYLAFPSTKKNPKKSF